MAAPLQQKSAEIGRNRSHNTAFLHSTYSIRMQYTTNKASPNCELNVSERIARPWEHYLAWAAML